MHLGMACVNSLILEIAYVLYIICLSFEKNCNEKLILPLLVKIKMVETVCLNYTLRVLSTIYLKI